MIKQKTVSAIIVAAGNGQRFGQDKLLLKIDQHTVLEKSIRAFNINIIDEIIVVCNQDKIVTYEQLIKQQLPKLNKIKFILGGRERWESSYLGVKAAKGEYVAIHDAARPLITTDLITQSLEAAFKYEAALVAAPATDSIKLVDEEHNNYDSLNRQTIWLAQTPQVFAKDLILKAYKLAFISKYQNMTDESELITKFLKLSVKIVPSTNHNLKITFPLDWEIAKLLASKNNS